MMLAIIIPPFLLVYGVIAFLFLVVLLVMIEIEVISYAFSILGLSPRIAMLALLASLIGSYVNIPLYSVRAGPVPGALMVNNFGVLYRIPIELAGPATTVAINVGGALVPILISAYALFKNPSAIFPSILGVAA
ncbi:MAG TPA: DUF1614 domain-containing protein, partial [Candidatus Binataceae bacterium]|nr:DUF1614 domain-containing protein [Candidatus Binataceae bacterium]